jgi:membrane protease YdiL (CAAX protease family)
VNKDLYLEDQKEGGKFFSKIGFTFIVITFATIVFQVILMSLMELFSIDMVSTNGDIIVGLSVSVVQIIFFILLMKNNESFHIEKNKMSILAFIGCIFVSFALVFIGDLIGTLLTDFIGNSLNSPVTNPVSEMIEESDIWSNVLLIVIFAPVFEELLFRKLLIDKTMKYGGFVSIIFSATLFGFFHGNFTQFFYAFLLGGFFALIYVKTGYIWYTIILHGIINFFGSILSGMLNSFFETNMSQDLTNTTINQIMLNINDYLGYFISIAINIFFYLMIIIGVILILYYFRKIKLPEGDIKLKKSLLFLNPGMICFLLLYLFVMVLSIFS